MAWSRKVCELIVPFSQDITKFCYTDPTPAHPQHCADQSAHHSAQKTIGCYAIYQTLFFLFPLTGEDGAKKGFDLRISLGKGGEILERWNQRSSSGHQLHIQRVREEIGPVCEKWILLPIHIIPVLPADGIEPAVGVWRHRIYLPEHDVRGQDRIDIVQLLAIYNPLIIKMKKILQGMYAGVGTRGAGELEGLPVEDAEGLLHLVLDGAGIVLDLKSAVMGASVGQFQEVSGHRVS